MFEACKYHEYTPSMCPSPIYSEKIDKLKEFLSQKLSKKGLVSIGPCFTTTTTALGIGQRIAMAFETLWSS